jgi:bis(5'-nucleosidyl)-tetraphosphatase
MTRAELPEPFLESRDLPNSEKPTVFAAGYLIFRKADRLEFLLMKHLDRWDLPKGHLDDGESIVQAAKRELWEETGISEDQIWTDPQFVFSSQYWVSKRKSPGHKALKQLSIYLGLALQDLDIVCTEHVGFRWWAWDPPHRIQTQAIDPLLDQVALHFQRHPDLFSRFCA